MQNFPKQTINHSKQVAKVTTWERAASYQNARTPHFTAELYTSLFVFFIFSVLGVHCVTHKHHPVCPAALTWISNTFDQILLGFLNFFYFY